VGQQFEEQELCRVTEVIEVTTLERTRREDLIEAFKIFTGRKGTESTCIFRIAASSHVSQEHQSWIYINSCAD